MGEYSISNRGLNSFLTGSEAENLCSGCGEEGREEVGEVDYGTEGAGLCLWQFGQYAEGCAVGIAECYHGTWQYSWSEGAEGVRRGVSG
jgi:hypothetical protein